MFNLIRKDILLTFSTKGNFLTIILLIPLMNLILGVSKPIQLIEISIIYVGYILTISSFSYEFRSKSNMLIQSLPIKKRDIVFSKYISIFINFIFSIIITVAYLWIISLFKIKTVDSFNFNIIKDTLSILLLGLSISLPLHFVLPPKIANFTNVFVLMMIINTIILGSNSINSMFNSKESGDFRLLIIAGVVWVLSMIISLFIYENRDLV
jgi:ABC-type transport system involved in multi-copper enzyme maturation permease subunit